MQDRRKQRLHDDHEASENDMRQQHGQEDRDLGYAVNSSLITLKQTTIKQGNVRIRPLKIVLYDVGGITDFFVSVQTP
jgi:hypothetical protein